MPQFCARLARSKAKPIRLVAMDTWNHFFCDVTVAHAPPVAVLFGKAMLATWARLRTSAPPRVGAADRQGQGFCQRTEVHAARVPAEFELEAAKHSRGCWLRPRLNTAYVLKKCFGRREATSVWIGRCFFGNCAMRSQWQRLKPYGVGPK